MIRPCTQSRPHFLINYGYLCLVPLIAMVVPMQYVFVDNHNDRHSLQMVPVSAAIVGAGHIGKAGPSLVLMRSFLFWHAIVRAT